MPAPNPYIADYFKAAQNGRFYETVAAFKEGEKIHDYIVVDKGSGIDSIPPHVLENIRAQDEQYFTEAKEWFEREKMRPKFKTEDERRAFVAEDDSDIAVTSNEDGLGEFEPMSPAAGE